MCNLEVTFSDHVSLLSVQLSNTKHTASKGTHWSFRSIMEQNLFICLSFFRYFFSRNISDEYTIMQVVSPCSTHLCGGRHKMLSNVSSKAGKNANKDLNNAGFIMVINWLCKCVFIMKTIHHTHLLDLKDSQNVFLQLFDLKSGHVGVIPVHVQN